MLDDDGRAVGPWVLQIEPQLLIAGLRAMMTTRVFDARDAHSAFRDLAQARNIGKLVLAPPALDPRLSENSGRPSTRSDTCRK